MYKFICNLFFIIVAMIGIVVDQTLRRAGINPAWSGMYGFGVAMTPDLGSGASIAFQTGFLANLLSMDWGGINRASVETTTLATTGGKTFMPGDTYDPGELSVEMQFDTDSAWVTALTAAAETVTITWPDAETAAASGFMTGFEITNVTKEGVMTANATIKFTGTITP